MKKRKILLIVTTILALSSCGSTPNQETTSSALVTTAAPITTVETKPIETTMEKSYSYNIGETWEVDGQWKLTIDSITETDSRNEYADTNPASVYIIEYTYENLGYEDKNGIMDGLFIDLSMEQIIDSNKKMGYSYPGDQELYATEVPVGASMTAQSVIGVDNSGDFPVTITIYDGNGNKQNATFNCKINE